MVRKQMNKQLWIKVLINSKFFEQRKIAKQIELLSNLQRLYMTLTFMLLHNENAKAFMIPFL